MNLLSGIWAGAKVLLGFSGANKGADNVMKIAGSVGQFIDEQNFTEEESHEHKLRLATAYVDYLDAAKDENTQRSITRREIAIWIIRVELLTLMLYGVLASAGIEAAKVWKEISFDSPLSLLTLGVGAFFFGTHLLRAAK
jgi:hypothetical protein